MNLIFYPRNTQKINLILGAAGPLNDRMIIGK